MFLKRRNEIALLLILLAAISWTFGQRLLGSDAAGDVDPAYTIAATETSYPPADPAGDAEAVPPTSGPYTNSTNGNSRTNRTIGFLFSFAAVIAAGIAVFLLAPKKPICGPDGACLAIAFLMTADVILESRDSILWLSTFTALMTASEVASAFAILLGIREGYGWIRAHFSLSWCLIQRTAGKCKTPQTSLLAFFLWILISLIGALGILAASPRLPGLLTPSCVFLMAAGLGLCCLWKYGADLAHFQKQLDNYQAGLPITIGDGALAQSEAQLLEIQAQHEEAVRTAITSERFKVELISNVSHDLRTPLTSILGYSELLQKESLSLEGRAQLAQLQQKAGYMNDLVESLFELTKVSSGVLESKKEEIDLVRLLEQTIGLFDDQLAQAGLTVRRSYVADSIPIITDGARMHQVFANLLGNAIKYALAGTRIYLEVKETASGYRVRMMNTACYEMDFDPQEIVQRFARGDQARSTKGSGLGLAIAQTYTESVGGSFRVSVDGDQFSAIVELPKIERKL